MPARTVNDRLLDKLVAHHIGVQRLAAEATDKALAKLKANDADIIALIRKSRALKGPASNDRIDRMLAAIQDLNARGYREIGDYLSSKLDDLADYEVEFESELFETVLPISWNVNVPDRKFLRAILAEEAMVGGLFNEWIEGMADGRYTRIRSAIRLGVSADEDLEDLIARIEGHRTQRYRDGAFALSWLSLAAITTTYFNHVTTQANASLVEENPDLIGPVMWIAILDDLTCARCAALDGKIWDSVGAAPWPQLHLNCRCMLVPIFKSWGDLGFDADELTDPQKEALDGEPPKRLTYSEWLANQDQETQDDILGKERARLFRGGLSVKKFVDYSGKRYTLAELKNIEARKLAPKSRTSRALAKSIVPRRNYGWTPDLPDQRDLLFAVAEPQEIALPVRVSLRDQMPPIFDQGSLGSCTAQAIVAAAMFALGKSTPMLSRLDLYYKERLLEDAVEEDSGAEIRDGIKALAKWGVCPESVWPYKIRSFKGPPPEQVDEEDDQYKITKYMRLKSHEDFMKALALGSPFVGGFTVYENFDSEIVEKRGILPVPSIGQKVWGGHAVCFIGYDSDFHNNEIFKASGLSVEQVPALMYEVRNSFGPSWGDQGHFWFPSTYAENRDLSDDYWILRSSLE